jgi:hypothetical protein
MTEVQDRNREVLAAVRVRRDDLYDSLLELERALAVPAGDHAREWAGDVGSVVERLRSVLDAHVAGTEAEGGFFDDVRDQSPQLLHAVEVLKAEHRPLVDATAALADRIAALGVDAGTDADAAVDDVRDQAVELIRDLLRHRHRGAELVYDAYSVDVSAAD